MVAYLKHIGNVFPIARKIAGIVLILVGFVALVMPVVPGVILMLLGLQLLGVRLLFWEKLKVRFAKRRVG